MGVLQTHMAKMYYAQRLPEESIQKLKELAEEMGMKPAQVMVFAISVYAMPEIRTIRDADSGKAPAQTVKRPSGFRSPIEIMIDRATGAEPTPKQAVNKPKPAGKPLPQVKVTVKAPITKHGGKIL